MHHELGPRATGEARATRAERLRKRRCAMSSSAGMESRFGMFTADVFTELGLFKTLEFLDTPDPARKMMFSAV